MATVQLSAAAQNAAATALYNEAFRPAVPPTIVAIRAEGRYRGTRPAATISTASAEHRIAGMSATAAVVFAPTDGQVTWHEAPANADVFNSALAEVAGSAFNPGFGALTSGAIAGLDATTVACVGEEAGGLRVITASYGGATFSTVGNTTFVLASGSTPAAAALQATRIALVDVGTGSLRTLEFDGTDWAQVGNALSLGTLTAPALTALNSTDVAFADLGVLRRYTFDGTDWAQVGSDAVLAGATDVAVAFEDTDAITLAVAASGVDLRLQRMEWDGATWVEAPGYSVFDRTGATLRGNLSAAGGVTHILQWEAAQSQYYLFTAVGGVPADLIGQGYGVLEFTPAAIISHLGGAGNTPAVPVSGGSITPYIEPLDLAVAAADTNRIFSMSFGARTFARAACDVGLPGSGATVELPQLDIRAGELVRLTSVTFTYPKNWTV